MLGNKWSKDQQNKLKSLIVKLAEKGKGIYEDFDSWHIANTLNALSKWNVLNSTIWTGTVQIEEGKKVTEVQLFKDFIVNLAEQGIQSSTQFNSQDIANTLNALSKWGVLNSETWTGKVQIEKGKEVNEVQLFKDFIVKLAGQGIQSSTQFNSQEIANIFDALYKFDILDNEKWTEDEQNKIKSLIVQLAKKGQEQKVLENFNSQAIANTFNAFSKLNILGNKWTGNEQEELKYFIVQLAKRGGGIEGYNLKSIAKIYSALLKLSNDADEFKSLADKLAEQVQAIAQKQNEEDNILDNIRFTSQIITGLPKLKSKKLITSDGQLLVHLMQCLSTSINKSKDSDLNEHLPKENILSVLEGFADIINGLEDKSDLIGKFDQSLIKIFNKLSAVELDSEYNNKISEIITNKLMGLEVIKDKDTLQKLLVGQSEDKGLERKMENLKISNVGQSNEPGTDLSGATISNQSPKAKTQGSH